MGEDDREGTGDEDRADLRGQDEIPTHPEPVQGMPFRATDFAQDKPLKRFLKSRTLWVVVGISVLIPLINFASEGYSSWKANGHIIKACNILQEVGNPLKEDMAWGLGINSTTPAIRAKLELASKEAMAAGSADPRHSTVLQNATLLFSWSLEGDNQSYEFNLYPPYDIYTYTIYPICTNNSYSNYLY